ncbi:EamA family transporter [Caldovatus sp. SYSU G05006]|uniref:EamA family transporter n=1 Tax=Caldovatus aquaticus TaxID=2865671 RepID=A0ABS7F2T8_9PROT|nr:EamA family transporter [Caldovatus aquaticus]MBW8269928.1 EamA family transporter [Caldovatus aquaticus]
MPHWLALAAAIGTSLVGQVLLKVGASGSVRASAGFLDQLLRWQTLVGLVCYGGAALLYIVALRRIPMSVALPCTAASYVAIALIGHFGFAEPMDARRVAAIALICLGVVLLASSA